MRQLILDTETTGLDPKSGHKIIEFAALEMIDRKLTGDYLHLYINPQREIDIGASRVHGIYTNDVKDKPNFKEVINEILAYIKDAELIIHNAKFDIGFLDYQFSELNRGIASDYTTNVIDTLSIARKKFPGAKNNLDALCDRFRIDRADRGFHGALIDCRLLSDIYLHLTREQIVLEGFEQKILNSNTFQFDKIGGDVSLKVPIPSEHDISLHNAILKKINPTDNTEIW